MIALLKVFLVEDECVVREGLRDCIDWERYGFEFCGDAPDGELALPQIRKLRPDILITDIKMPFMDGLALSKLVCAELPETKIILISGHNDFEFAQEAIEIGVEQYLLKPVTKSSLLKTLEDVSRKIDAREKPARTLGEFQFLVSNPPYIPSADIDTLDASVREHEPRLALDGGADGLDFYRVICEKWRDALCENGMLFFEVGIGQADQVLRIMRSHGFGDIQIVKDLNNIPRVVYGTRVETI